MRKPDDVSWRTNQQTISENVIVSLTDYFEDLFKKKKTPFVPVKILPPLHLSKNGSKYNSTTRT
jgi:hypothetical protein